MPIPALKQQAPPIPPGAPVPPHPVHWERTYVSIRGSNGEGEEIPLTNFSDRRWPGILLQPGATGLDAPPVELYADESPNLDGSIFRSARVAQREIMLPIYLHGIDRRTLRELKRRLINELNPRRGYCVLKFVDGDMPPRYLHCYYKGGMEGSESVDDSGFTWKRYGLQFTAFDPWFYADDVQAFKWSIGTKKIFLPADEPFLPLKLNSGVLSDPEVTIDNPGDVDAWPLWKLVGPIRAFTFTRPDGASFGITPQDETDAVPAGRVLRVDTRPGYKTLLDDQDTNYWPQLDPNPVLWSIPPGRSTVELNVTVSSGSASLELSFRPRYESY